MLRRFFAIDAALRDGFRLMPTRHTAARSHAILHDAAYFTMMAFMLPLMMLRAPCQRATMRHIVLPLPRMLRFRCLLPISAMPLYDADAIRCLPFSIDVIRRAQQPRT